MTSSPNFSSHPMRQVHLDFHTSPDIPDVGADWDANLFARTLTEARVNSINIFAKCHHGMNYYPTKIGPVHPSLKFDLLGEQIEACHRADIRCPIYVSIGWDESAAERHPEWRQVDKNGKLVGRAPFDAYGWPWMCVNTGYGDELIAQTEELMSLYECDGFWYDILMYHNDSCLCSQCLPEMRRAGMDPENPLHRHQHNNMVARRFMERASKVIRAKLPEAAIFYNSRFGFHFEDEVQHYSQVEIESLPTGGWGYGFYPLYSRFARGFGMPMVGMTGRFHRSWADWGGLKHPDALRFECGGIVATGGLPCIGDQMHPRGRLNKTIYEVIGEAFRDVEAIEPYCLDAEGVAQIGLLVLQENKTRAEVGGRGGSIEGATKMLNELHHQFDVITAKCDDFSQYELLVIPDQADVTPEMAERLRDFVRGGGKLLVSHQALLDEESGNFVLADELGVDYLGAAPSNPDYFEITDAALQGTVSRPNFAYSLYEGPTVRVAPREGTHVLAQGYATYFNRTWEHFSSHSYTPPLEHPADYPAVTQAGNVAYIGGPIFGAYQKHGNLTFRAVVDGCLRLLLPDLMLETNAPASAEVTLMRQESRQLVHIVNYSPGRRAPEHVEVLDAPIPLHDVTVQLRGVESANRVFLGCSGESIPFDVKEGSITVTVPRVQSHEVVVIE